MLFLPAIVASLGLANAAVVTVTNHVHADALVSVQGILYVENGQTRTTFVTEGGAQPTSVSNQISSSVVAVPATPSGSQATESSSTPASGSVTVITETAGSPASTSGSAAPSTSGSSSSSGSAAPSSSESAPAPSTSGSVAAQSFSEPSSTSASASATPSVSQVPNAAFASASSSSSSSAPASTSSAATTTLSPSSSSQAPSSASSAAPSSASSSAAPSSSGSSDFQNTMVDRHNDKRSQHQSTGSLEWDDELANYAQNYADKYDCSGDLVHSNGPYGENLAVGYDDEGTIDAWYDEIKKYSFSDPVFSESTGHFTQLVWKSSTKVGCGSKQCGGSVGKYIICNYNPAGNFIGDFSQNVLPTL
ncbi:hypothetical protein ZYGR_0AD06630 [Zygosaccharomyces rouxii]|uniref:ZYRO0G21340p n=2 Tax=Zygosaccharomyces rouxii TaxID=4956 RepID=C5E1I8_ZYGRC|nr:uncharacterized protein ZYRO0G21340g [Zygosaccharomyces rouxii]KAH9202962.1 CAP domain-containing protein [Zygosaccharomyces rouxii]GAV51480.1 hypothetical protein ZYGR_0AD06630 [Zygosaccharomyces rouxii]CAR29972.1 ZYRO0G21340p [Zygosaccharomyces rouxii]